VPEVVLWKLASQTHSILSPASIVIEGGEKLSPPVPTWTVKVLANDELARKRESAPANPRMALRP